MRWRESEIWPGRCCSLFLLFFVLPFCRNRMKLASKFVSHSSRKRWSDSRGITFYVWGIFARAVVPQSFGMLSQWRTWKWAFLKLHQGIYLHQDVYIYLLALTKMLGFALQLQRRLGSKWAWATLGLARHGHSRGNMWKLISFWLRCGRNRRRSSEDA